MNIWSLCLYELQVILITTSLINLSTTTSLWICAWRHLPRLKERWQYQWMYTFSQSWNRYLEENLQSLCLGEVCNWLYQSRNEAKYKIWLNNETRNWWGHIPKKGKGITLCWSHCWTPKLSKTPELKSQLLLTIWNRDMLISDKTQPRLYLH